MGETPDRLRMADPGPLFLEEQGLFHLVVVWGDVPATVLCRQSGPRHLPHSLRGSSRNRFFEPLLVPD
jgi:hypothetical protein